MKRTFDRAFVVLGVLLVAGSTSPASARADIGALGAMGDSLSDEYFEETYSYAHNWVEQLVDYRGLDVGPTAAEAGQPGHLRLHRRHHPRRQLPLRRPWLLDLLRLRDWS